MFQVYQLAEEDGQWDQVCHWPQAAGKLLPAQKVAKSGSVRSDEVFVSEFQKWPKAAEDERSQQ